MKKGKYLYSQLGKLLYTMKNFILYLEKNISSRMEVLQINILKKYQLAWLK